jgi:hypothetical protein
LTPQGDGLGHAEGYEHGRLQTTGHLRLARHGLDGLATDDADADARPDGAEAECEARTQD